MSKELEERIKDLEVLLVVMQDRMSALDTRVQTTIGIINEVISVATEGEV